MTSITPESRAPWRRLAAQLRRAHPPGTCRHVSAQLPLFVSDELAGYDVDALYAQTGAHLDLCPRCLSAYAELSGMLREALHNHRDGAAPHE